jgi:hypothetical protein
MRGTLASRTVLAFATLMLLGACNTPYDPSIPDPPDDSDVRSGEQAPETKPEVDKGKGLPPR